MPWELQGGALARSLRPMELLCEVDLAGRDNVEEGYDWSGAVCKSFFLSARSNPRNGSESNSNFYLLGESTWTARVLEVYY